MNFTDMKLSSKLVSSFAILILLTILVGGLGIWQMSRINDSTTDIATDWLPSVKALGVVRNAANGVRRVEPDHILSSDETERAEVDKRLVTAKAKLEKAIADYEPLVSDAGEKKLFQDLLKGKDAYYATQEKLLTLSRGGAGTLDQTKAYFRGESRETFSKFAEAIGTSVEYNDKGADDAYAKAKSVYASASAVSIGLVIAASAIAAVLAMFILRSVNGLLGGEPAEAARLAKQVASGNLSNQINIKSGDTSSMMAALKEMQASLSNVVNSVRSGSEGVATASAQIAQGNNDLSARTEQQASALEETAASMEELSSTVKQNADSARQANQLAMNASTVAARGGAVVGEVVQTMKGINEASRKISDIISVIDGIAFQTNILALNAAVEAARAGEQGRGFAVVASEVRSLAGRSAEAAKEIKTLINTSVERVEQGTTLVDQAGTTMAEVVSSIKRVTDLMGEISAASNEQAAGVSQIGEAVQQMDQVTQQNAALVEEMAAAASSLQSQANDLVQVVGVFKLDGDSGFSSSKPKAPSGMRRTPPTAPRAVGAPKRAGISHAPSKPASKPMAIASTSSKSSQGGDADWESF